MTKKQLLIIFLVTSNILLYGQRYKTDTVDYNVFFNSKPLACYKITEGKLDRATMFKVGQLFITNKVKDPKLLGPIASFINPNDTVIFSEWDIENGLSIIQGHTAGKIKLNKQTNLITLEKRYWSDSNKTTVRKFKILKWTATEIILADFSNFDKNIKYYFK